MRDALVGAFLEYTNEARLSLLKKAHEFMKFLSVDNIQSLQVQAVEAGTIGQKASEFKKQI